LALTDQTGRPTVEQRGSAKSFWPFPMGTAVNEDGADMRRRTPSPAPAATIGLSRRTFLLVGAAAGVGIGLSTSAPTPVAALPATPAAITLPERPHRTLLGLL
jgi:hypothetical protein